MFDLKFFYFFSELCSLVFRLKKVWVTIFETKIAFFSQSFFHKKKEYYYYYFVYKKKGCEIIQNGSLCMS